MKMHQGHHGANHPVKDLTTGKVEITSMNHGFAVDKETLPKNVAQTHVSLFDGSNCGIALKDKPVFSVQYHPEASPGPRDSHYLFTRFVDMMRQAKDAQEAQDRVGDVRLDQLLRLQAFGDLCECASSRRALPQDRRGHPRLHHLAGSPGARLWLRRGDLGRSRGGGKRPSDAGRSRAQCARRARRALCRQCPKISVFTPDAGGGASRRRASISS